MESRGHVVNLVCLLFYLRVELSSQVPCQNSTCANSFARLEQNITGSIACETERGWRLSTDSQQPASFLMQIQHTYPNMSADELPTGYCQRAGQQSLIKHVGIPVDGATVCATFEWTACLCGTSTGCPSGNCSLFVPTFNELGQFAEIGKQHASVDFGFRGFVHSPLKSTQVLAYEKQASAEYAKYMSFRFGLQQKIQSCNASSEVAAAPTKPAVSVLPQCRLPYWRVCSSRNKKENGNWDDWTGSPTADSKSPIGKLDATKAIVCEPCKPDDPGSCKPGGMVTTWSEPKVDRNKQGKKLARRCHKEKSGPCKFKWTRATIRGSEYWPPSPNRCSSDSPLVQAWFGYAGFALLSQVFSDEDVSAHEAWTAPRKTGRIPLTPSNEKNLHPMLKHAGGPEGCPTKCKTPGEFCEFKPGLCAGGAGQLATAVINAVQRDSQGTRLCVRQDVMTGTMIFYAIAGSTYTGSCETPGWETKKVKKKGKLKALYPASDQPVGTCSASFRVSMSRALSSPRSISTPGSGSLTEPLFASSVEDVTKQTKTNAILIWREEANDRGACAVIEQAVRKGVKEFREAVADQGELGEQRIYQHGEAAYQCTARSSSIGFAQHLCDVSTRKLDVQDEIVHHSGSEDVTLGGVQEEGDVFADGKVTEDVDKATNAFTQTSVMSANEAFAWL